MAIINRGDFCSYLLSWRVSVLLWLETDVADILKLFKEVLELWDEERFTDEAEFLGGGGLAGAEKVTKA